MMYFCCASDRLHFVFGIRYTFIQTVSTVSLNLRASQCVVRFAQQRCNRYWSAGRSGAAELPEEMRQDPVDTGRASAVTGNVAAPAQLDAADALAA